MTGDEPVDVVIVGAGIAGLATANALARVGRRVRVLEREPVPGESGYGVQLAANATRILRGWGLLEEIADRGVLPRRAVLRDAGTGDELTFVDLGDTERRYGAPYVVLHRATLHEVLLEACKAAGVEVVTDVHVTGVTLPQPGAVNGSAVAAVHSSARCDRARVVVAADGLRSRLRDQISDDQVRDTGYVAYRGVRAFTEVADTGVALDETTLWIGPDRHFVQYALDGGESVNSVAVFRPRSRLAEVLRGPGDTSAPFSGLGEPFARDCAYLRTATGLLDPTRSFGVYDRDPIQRWVHRRLVLVGDAAHPMLQYLAQGACQALEDANALGQASDQYQSNWDGALAAYCMVRVSRATQMQLRVRRWGDYLHMTDARKRQRREAALRRRDPTDYSQLDWLYMASA